MPSEFRSDRVQSFYERMPYPAPLTNLDRHLELYQNPARQRALFHLMFPTEKPQREQQILVAGCGTSQAATIALREPDAQITAIDISEPSLRHTRNLQRQYHLENLELHQLAIADVQNLGCTFDQIICTGVLHHLLDPDGGLSALRQVLKPTGAMHLMVYALYGRTGIYLLQDYCRLLGIGTSPRELEELGTTLDTLPSDHPLTAILHQTKDFKHPDALADALLHPQDRAYTVPQLFEWLKRCGMSFGRWFEQAPYLPQCGELAKTPHATHLGKLPSQDQYAAVELFRGTMTKHNFIAYRDDYPKERQPIQLDDERGSSRNRDRWRHYIPLRLPWCVSIREGLPPNVKAILINRSHTYSDLALPLDAEQDRIFREIDGKRSIGEILQLTDGESQKKRVLKFFKRLWQYDQIVFDVSHSM